MAIVNTFKSLKDFNLSLKLFNLINFFVIFFRSILLCALQSFPKLGGNIRSAHREQEAQEPSKSESAVDALNTLKKVSQEKIDSAI